VTGSAATRVFRVVVLSAVMATCVCGAERTFTEDGAWNWCQDPRAVFVKGERARTYAQWVTRDGRLQVGA